MDSPAVFVPGLPLGSCPRAADWFGDSRRLLGVWRVLFALSSAAAIAFAVLPTGAALRAITVAALGTATAGEYGRSVLGGVMGDFLGATICMLELAVLLSISADAPRADGAAIARMVIVLSLPQAYGVWRRRYEGARHSATVPRPIG